MLTGMGECWVYILESIGKEGKIIGIDFSEEMLKYAELKQKKWSDFDIEILNENVFEDSIKSSSIDVVVSGFGMKTFTGEQMEGLAKEFSRILKAGG
jgi:ubiquinone/menaquinone biosynthesis C-methylase UbiE